MRSVVFICGRSHFSGQRSRGRKSGQLIDTHAREGAPDQLLCAGTGFPSTRNICLHFDLILFGVLRYHLFVKRQLTNDIAGVLRTWRESGKALSYERQHDEGERTDSEGRFRGFHVDSIVFTFV